MSNLQETECAYPNGDLYVVLSVHNKRIGSVTKLDGGYLAQGRRKPVATVDEAAKQLIDSEISKHHNEIQALRAMLATVLGK
jgi:hypothetical protein